MVTFMGGFLAVITTRIFTRLIAFAAIVASWLLIDQATHYRGD